MELIQVKVDRIGKGRSQSTIEEIRKRSKVSISNLPDGSGVRVRVSRNMVPVSQFHIKGYTTKNRNEIVEYVRKNKIETGELDKELMDYRNIEKSRKLNR